MKGIITDDSKYVVKGEQIRCYDVDGAQRLKPSSFMDLAQEMAYLAADAMHFGYDELKPSGLAWVLSRLHFIFEEAPVWGEKVDILTWHKGPAGPFYLRDFMINDLSGKTKVRGTSSWVILDVVQRRMVRTTDVVEMIPETTVCKDSAIETPAGRVMMPRGIEPEHVSDHVVSYSDIDLVGHTNNAKYVVWAMDCIDYNIVAEKPIKELEINFNHETKQGETVSLFRYRDGDTWYIEGKVEDRQAFCTSIKF